MEWILELSGAEVAVSALAIACAAVCLSVVALLKRPSRDAKPGGAAFDLIQLRESVLQLETELARVGGDINGRIDAKMRTLRGLLDGADAAIRQLRQLPIPAVRAPISRATTPDPFPTSPGPKPGDPVADAPIKSEPAPLAQKRTEPATLESGAQRYSHVYSLADAGLDSARISAETGMHRGEVELVLNLRQKKFRLDRAGRSEPAHAVNYSEEARV